MTRPEIIRADSIDLQDRDAPSAKYHNQPVKPSPNGSLAPHQAETIREVAQETAEENLRSPRVSWVNGDAGDLQQYADDLANGVSASLQGSKMQQEDSLAIAQNGGVSSQGSDDGGDVEGDADDGLDDDMMDKISSSPSIEDGGYSLPPVWPRRIDSLPSPAAKSSSQLSHVRCEMRSSSPYLDLPDFLPLPLSSQKSSDESSPSSPSRHHHLPGEYNEHIHSSTPATNSPCLEEEAQYTVGKADRRVEEEDSFLTYYVTDIEDGTLGPETRDGEICDAAKEVENEEMIRPGPPWASHKQESLEIDEAIGDFEIGELTIPYESSLEDDDDDFSGIDDARFIDSGWGGECLQDTEDIDFEFVYALHTFVATVEGQANATKGDTMVLLDDSNSYWWLVRVVKDSSIGYLPAEHIETPTERLARLNKHRNVDLSATMLGDTAEKAKNPIKTAMRRRKVKTVQFAAPTYVDYSEIEYSTEEEEEEDGEYYAGQQQRQRQQQQQSNSQQSVAENDMDDETAKVEPLKPKGQREVRVESPEEEDSDEMDPSKEEPRSSDEIFQLKSDGPAKNKNGTVRDSFFKDDTVETKKITLTPNLLRDDNAPRPSSESAQLKQRPSLDKLEKDSPQDKGKEDKKRREKEKKDKEKKPSAIRSFFSRKDKKKSADDDDESLGKRSMDTVSLDRDSGEHQDLEEQPSPGKGSPPQRQHSKLQKVQPRTEPLQARKPGGPGQATENGMDLAAFLSEEKPNNVANVPPSMRIVEPDSQENEDGPLKASAMKKEEKGGISKIIPGLSPTDARPQKVAKAKSRMELDDFDSAEEEVAPSEPVQQPPEKPDQQLRPTLPGAYPDSYQSVAPTAPPTKVERPIPAQAQPRQSAERLSESPVEISPMNSRNPPALMGDTSSQEDHSSPTASPSPELLEAEDEGVRRNQDSMTTSSTSSNPTWNDSNLRAFFDAGSEIRDLLVVVNDTSDVAPAGPEHPVAGSLFREQNAKLAEITTQLDNMLGDWLARKQRLRGTV